MLATAEISRTEEIQRLLCDELELCTDDELEGMLARKGDRQPLRVREALVWRYWIAGIIVLDGHYPTKHLRVPVEATAHAVEGFVVDKMWRGGNRATPALLEGTFPARWRKRVGVETWRERVGVSDTVMAAQLTRRVQVDEAEPIPGEVGEPAEDLEDAGELLELVGEAPEEFEDPYAPAEASSEVEDPASGMQADAQPDGLPDGDAVETEPNKPRQPSADAIQGSRRDSRERPATEITGTGNQTSNDARTPIRPPPGDEQPPPEPRGLLPTRDRQVADQQRWNGLDELRSRARDVSLELSVSKLRMIHRCGMQYHYRYPQKMKLPPGVSRYVGSAVHWPIEIDLRTKMVTGELISTEEVRDLAAEDLEALWEEQAPVLFEEELELGQRKMRGQAKDKAVDLAVLHHEVVAPKRYPEAVEQPFIIEVPGRDWRMQGFIDVREPDAVWDTKTGKKSPSKNSAHESIQLTAYGLHLRTEEGKGRAPAVLGEDHLIRTPGGEKTAPQVYHKPRTTTRDDPDFLALLQRGQLAYDYVKAGKFLPAAEDSWWCSERWCGYWNICPFGARGRSNRPRN